MNSSIPTPFRPPPDPLSNPSAPQMNSSIQTLDLSGNTIRSAGTAVLATALDLRECGLERLNLAHNPIGEYGGNRLMRLLINGKVQRCDLAGTSFIEMGYVVGQPVRCIKFCRK
eukprot:462530-Prorocentrum_minimum.AAC.1